MLPSFALRMASLVTLHGRRRETAGDCEDHGGTRGLRNAWHKVLENC